jgi:hypothetical protein
MGIAWLLLRRTFASRPKRTLLFLLGYALATSVMINLLAVGQAVLQQAEDKDLLGGGDIILTPQGIDIESMKVGGTDALYYSIPQARFIVRQILGSSRFENQIAAASPYLFSKLVYLRRDSHIESVFADGSIPEQEEAVKQVSLPWKNSAEDVTWLRPAVREFYHEIDRFHLPSVQSADLSRWAEWHYFNFESNDFYGYLSVMAAGDPGSSRAQWIVSLQMIDPAYHRYAATFPLPIADLPLQRVDYQAGRSSVRFVNDHYVLSLRFHDRVPVEGDLDFYPPRNLYFPPAYLAQGGGFESGYVIPAIRGEYRGSLRIGGKHYDFNNVAGYHDHNWGIWQKTEWNWGHLFSPEYSIFFGEIFLSGKSRGLFLAVFDHRGFVSVFRPQFLRFSEYRSKDPSVPMKLELQDSKRFSSIHLQGDAQSFVATEQDSKYFIQYKMNYQVTLQIDGRSTTFLATGNAETFVPAGSRTQ